MFSTCFVTVEDMYCLSGGERDGIGGRSEGKKGGGGRTSDLATTNWFCESRMEQSKSHPPWPLGSKTLCLRYGVVI